MLRIVSTASRDDAPLRPRFLSRFRRVTTSGGFIAEVDGLRFVAIFSVFLFHLAVGLEIKAPPAYGRPADSWLAMAAWNGFHGVELFFVISGFILALPFAGHFLRGERPVDLKQYFLRRVTRLEPPYLLCMLILFALHVLVRGRSAAELRPHLWASLVYLHNLVFASESPINNVAWSLEIEIQFYLLMPFFALLFAIRGKARRRVAIAGLWLLSIGLSWFFISPGQRAYLSILRFAHFFLMGILLADLYLTDWRDRPERAAAWDLLSAVGWPILFLFWGAAQPAAPGQAPPSETLWAALVFPALAFLLYCAAFRGPLTGRALRNPWITTIGGMCYTIYLLHNPALAMILARTRGVATSGWYALDLLVQLALTAPLVLLPSCLYFALVERPCMRRDWPRRLLERIQSLRPAMTSE